MNKICFVAAVVILVLAQSDVFSQSQEPLPKFEVAAEFTTFERDSLSGQRTEPGFGGRFTYNINRIFSVEGAGYFFPKKCSFDCVDNGRVTEVLGGVKVGKRFEKWGIFAKARPGVVSFSEGDFEIFATPGGSFPFDFKTVRVNAFATDIGGVLEFYPSKHIVTRIDAGDTIMHFGRVVRNRLRLDPLTNEVVLFPFVQPSRTTHHFQFITSVGFRF